MKRAAILTVIALLLAGCGVDDGVGPGTSSPVPPGGEDWSREEADRLAGVEEECGSMVRPGQICPDDVWAPARVDSSRRGSG